MPWLVDSGWGRFWLVKLVKIKDLSAFYPRGFFVIFVSSFAFLCWEMIQDVVSLFLRIIGGLDARINCSSKSQIQGFFRFPCLGSDPAACAVQQDPFHQHLSKSWELQIQSSIFGNRIRMINCKKRRGYDYLVHI